MDTFKSENWACKKAVKWFIEKSSTSGGCKSWFYLEYKRDDSSIL